MCSYNFAMIENVGRGSRGNRDKVKRTQWGNVISQPAECTGGPVGHCGEKPSLPPSHLSCESRAILHSSSLRLAKKNSYSCVTRCFPPVRERAADSFSRSLPRRVLRMIYKLSTARHTSAAVFLSLSFSPSKTSSRVTRKK